MTQNRQAARAKRPIGQKIRSFRAAAAGLKNVQCQLFAEIVRRNSTCSYGEFHSFSEAVECGEYWRLPLMSYDRVEGIDGYWGDVRNFTSDRLIAYFLTSGSSSEPKRIPVTSSLVREKARAFSIFWESIYASHPGLKNGHFIANFADSGHWKRDDDGVLEIAETTFWNQRMQGFQDASRWPAGKLLTKIHSAELRYYAAVRLALQGPLHCMMSLNPSTLVKFCRVITEHSGDLVRGLREKKWGIEELDTNPDLPDGLSDALQENPVAAQVLADACASKDEDFQLRDIWADLELIICWQSDLVEPFLRLLRRHTAGVDYRDYITQSSECVMAIPIADNCAGGLLAYTSHFFEFIPEERIDAAAPETIPAWGLEQGQKYEVVVTTGGGLYRYRTGDCILVDGFEGEIPRISFQYRLGRTSSITGEKLTEQQVLAALDQARSVGGVDSTDVVVFPRTGDQPHYAVMLPSSATTDCDRASNATNWIAAFDRALGQANGEYKDKRESRRLGEPCMVLIDSADFDSFQQAYRAEHVGDDQYKPGVLRKERDLDAGIRSVDEIRAHR